LNYDSIIQSQPIDNRHSSAFRALSLPLVCWWLVTIANNDIIRHARMYDSNILITDATKYYFFLTVLLMYIN